VRGARAAHCFQLSQAFADDDDDDEHRAILFAKLLGRPATDYGAGPRHALAPDVNVTTHGAGQHTSSCIL